MIDYVYASHFMSLEGEASLRSDIKAYTDTDEVRFLFFVIK